MKQLVIFVLLYSVGAIQPTRILNEHLHQGGIEPKLTLVATVDGKAFFVDRTTARNRFQALAYCESLGMHLAEITSANQFTVLDQTVVEEWPNGSCAWTGGIEVRTILRYGWENSNEGVDPSYIPYEERLVEESIYFLVFSKYVNASYVTDAIENTTCSAVLCETLPIVKLNLT